MQTILVLGSEEDPHVLAVCDFLRKRHADYTIADLQGFPTNSLASLRFDSSVKCIFTRESKQALALDEVGAVWYRRLFPPTIDSAITDQDAKRFTMGECRAFLSGLWSVLSDRPWMNPYVSNHQAELKLRQLAVAQGVGLTIPETIVTNDVTRVQEFFERNDRKIIYKPLSSFATDSEFKDGKLTPSKCIYTTLITREALDKLAPQVKLAPCLFQDYIPKDLELRITVVGDEFFTAAIHSQKSSLSKIDWRKYDLENTPYEPFDLPDDVRSKLRRFMDAFGIIYGAIDCILTPKGEIVFLEVNPGGQWLWVEVLTGMPISEAIADHLIQMNVSQTANLVAEKSV